MFLQGVTTGLAKNTHTQKKKNPHTSTGVITPVYAAYKMHEIGHTDVHTPGSNECTCTFMLLGHSCIHCV